jgi:glycine/D-amino acid oxidase-like deaminating enzyme
MTAGSYDAIVIGGGPGGLACSALLSKWGARTLLLEKNEHTGGKAVTPLRNGFRYELGPKLQVPMRDPAFAALFRELGIEEKLGQILLLDGSSLSYKGRSGQYKTMVAPQTSDDPTPLFDLMQLDAAERQQALAVLGEMVLLPGSGLDALDDVTMEDWLGKRTVPHALYNYRRCTPTRRWPSRSIAWPLPSRSRSSSRSRRAAVEATTAAASGVCSTTSRTRSGRTAARSAPMRGSARS